MEAPTRALLAVTALLSTTQPAQLVTVVSGGEVQVRINQQAIAIAVPGLECPSPLPTSACATNYDACQKQRVVGRDAVQHARELLVGKLTVGPSTKLDKLGRALSPITLEDGRDYATVMLEDGFCRPATPDVTSPSDRPAQ